jgi:PAT family beta-lactamase induction signal transducer AmpG
VVEPESEGAEAGPGQGGSDGGPRAAVWVGSSYFAEGFPYAVVHNVANVLFKELGASLQEIGLTSLFHLPWNLKFLWGPLLDGFGTKRGWLVGIELLLSLVLVALAVAVPVGAPLAVLSALFAVLAVLSATHDIAIDGFYLEALDPPAQSRWVGLRATFYKIAMIVVAGPLLWAAGRLGFGLAFGVAALIMAGLYGLHLVLLPRVEVARRSFAALGRQLVRPGVLAIGVGLGLAVLGVRALLGTEAAAAVGGALAERFPRLASISAAGWIALSLLLALLLGVASLGRLRRLVEGQDSFYARAFVSFLEQDQVTRILAFVILFRAGESFLLTMRYPFLRDIGMSLTEYSFASGTVGLIASFTATLLGGALIARHGLARWIWPFTLGQNALNLLYLSAAWWAGGTPGGAESGVGPAVALGLPVLTTVIALEAFGAGFGTAVFMVYLMRCCDPGHKAAHMAILTALMSVSFTLAGVASGFLAEAMGYTVYFAVTVLVTVPGMVLIPFLPHLAEARTEGRQ